MSRGCLTVKGKLKVAFATEATAQKHAGKQVGYAPYPCKAHGWHIGSVVSRGLRSAVYGAKNQMVRTKKESAMRYAARKRKIRKLQRKKND